MSENKYYGDNELRTVLETLCKNEILLKQLNAILDSIPTADVVEVKRGKWKLNRDGSGTCSECHFTQRDVWNYDNWQNYCGVCGAKMNVEEQK